MGTLGVTGKYMDADVDSTTVDFTASRPIYTLPAGDVGFAVGLVTVVMTGHRK
ncbi:hypothetical protein C6W84_5040 [Acinetobacter baumannii]|nr:hypothetical protein C6W84_5040 [Acinetobacter baumannii]